MTALRWIVVVELDEDLCRDGFVVNGEDRLTSERLTGALRSAFPYARSGGIRAEVLLPPTAEELDALGAGVARRAWRPMEPSSSETDG